MSQLMLNDWIDKHPFGFIILFGVLSMVLMIITMLIIAHYFPEQVFEAKENKKNE